MNKPRFPEMRLTSCLRSTHHKPLFCLGGAPGRRPSDPPGPVHWWHRFRWTVCDLHWLCVPFWSAWRLQLQLRPWRGYFSQHITMAEINRFYSNAVMVHIMRLRLENSQWRPVPEEFCASGLKKVGEYASDLRISWFISLFLLTYTSPYWNWLRHLSVIVIMFTSCAFMTDIIVITHYANDPPKNVTFKKKQCEALLGRRDVLLITYMALQH